MTLYYLQPVSVLDEGGYTATGGSSLAVISDGTPPARVDATYLLAAPGSASTLAGSNNITLSSWGGGGYNGHASDFGTEIPWRVRAVAHMSYGDEPDILFVFLKTVASQELANKIEYCNGTPSATPDEVATGWVQPGSDLYYGLLVGDAGGPYQAQVAVWSYQSANRTRVTEVWVELETTTTPTVSVTAAGTVTTTSPTVAWSYSDGDGWAQTGYRVKVFNSTQYGAGGFDPATSTPERSVSAYTAEGEVQVIGLDATKTYKTYVQVAKTVNGVRYFSDWESNSAWTISNYPIDVDVTVTDQPVNARVHVAVTPYINMMDSENASSISDDTSDWVGTDCTLARVTTPNAGSEGALEITSTSAGSIEVRLDEVNSPVSVPASTEITASVQLYSAATSRNCKVRIVEYDTDDNITADTESSSAASTVGDWTQFSHTVTTQSDTDYAQVRVGIIGTALSEVHYIDHIMVNSGDTAQSYNHGGFTAGSILIERETDAGWETVRGGDIDMGIKYQQRSVYDYEAPRGVNAIYRGTVNALNPSGNVTSVTESTPVAVTADGQWWLKAVADPTLNTVATPLNKLDIKVDSDVGVFRPLDGDTAIVVSGAVGGLDGSYDFHTSTEVEWAALKPILWHPGTVLVQDSLGRQKYLRWTERDSSETSAAGEVRRTTTVSYIEVGSGLPSVAS